MGIKVAIGKLLLPESIDRYIASRMGQLAARSLEISATHALRAAALPLHHRDPFDRMLIAWSCHFEGLFVDPFTLQLPRHRGSKAF